MTLEYGVLWWRTLCLLIYCFSYVLHCICACHTNVHLFILERSALYLLFRGKWHAYCRIVADVILPTCKSLYFGLPLHNHWHCPWPWYSGWGQGSRSHTWDDWADEVDFHVPRLWIWADHLGGRAEVDGFLCLLRWLSLKSLQTNINTTDKKGSLLINIHASSYCHCCNKVHEEDY